MKKIILIFVFFNILSCNNIDDLGSGYYYLSSDDASDIGYPYGSIIYKTNQKKSFKNIIIYPEIINIKYNEEYILSIQQPNEILILKRIKDDLRFWSRYYSKNKKDSLVSLFQNKILLSDIRNLVGNNKSEKINEIADSIFKNQLFYMKMFQNKSNYYIIQKVNDSIFGPLTFNEFEAIKKKKSIFLEFE
jgi:hypothetical protein